MTIVTITGTVEDIDGCRLQVGYDRDGLVRVGPFAFTADGREQMNRLLHAADAEAARVRGEITERYDCTECADTGTVTAPASGGRTVDVPCACTAVCRDCGATGDLLEHPEGLYCRDILACHSRRDDRAASNEKLGALA